MEYLGCNGCKHCCITDAANITEAKEGYCGTEAQCNPYSFIRTLLPIVMAIIFVYLSIACCIKREQYTFDEDEYKELFRPSGREASNTGVGKIFNHNNEES